MKKILAVLFMGLTLLVFPITTQAQTSLSDSVGGQLKAGGAKAGFDTKSEKPPQVIIAEIIQVMLTGVGIVLTILFVRSGYWYITSNGETEKIDRAKKTMQGALIGLGVVLAAYSITGFVVKRLTNVTSGKNIYKVQNNSAPRNLIF